jgi:hypothetical protein
MKKLVLCAAMLSLGLAGAGLAQDTTAKQDAKQAGRDTKSAAKHTGRATKKTARRGYHGAKHTVNKGAAKTEQKTR